MDIVTQVQEQIQAVARPLYDRLLLLDEEIGTREQELGELKKARTQLRNVVKGIDPSLLPEPEKPKKKNSNDWTPKAGSAEALYEFLLGHEKELNGNGFHAAGLTSQFPTELPVAYSSVHKVLGLLRDQGLVRLDSTGTGGAKFYKLVVDA